MGTPISFIRINIKPELRVLPYRSIVVLKHVNILYSYYNLKSVFIFDSGFVAAMLQAVYSSSDSSVDISSLIIIPSYI
jgi:hypothetical protein